MSDPHFPKSRSCHGKRRYHSMKEAGFVARRMKQKGNGRLTVYRCEHCSRPEASVYHIGHTPLRIVYRLEDEAWKPSDS